MLRFWRFADKAEGLRRGGDAARDARCWEEAVTSYEAYLAERPADAAIWVQLGHAHKESGNRNEAESSYLRALNLTPLDADLHLHLGHLYKITGQIELAKKHYRRSVQLDPGSPAAEELATALPEAPDPVVVSPPAVPATSGPSPSAFADVSDIVRAVYRAALRVDPDPAGLNIYSEALRNGMPLEAFISELVSLGQVREAYRGVLNRDPERAAIDLYQPALQRGMAQASLIAELYRTPEFRSSPHNEGRLAHPLLRDVSGPLLRDVSGLAEDVLKLHLVSKGYAIQMPSGGEGNASPTALFKTIRSTLHTLAYLVALPPLGKAPSAGQSS